SEGPVRSYRVADFASLAAADDAHVLDVRRRDEWDAGHLPGAQHIPFYDVPARLDEVPRDEPVWVHCASAARTAIVASLLDAADVLDVRRRDEWDAGHLPGAQHIPFYDVPARLDEVRRDEPVWVHCASGARAAIVASLLDAADVPVVLVDDRWAHAVAAGLDVVDAA